MSKNTFLRGAAAIIALALLASVGAAGEPRTEEQRRLDLESFDVVWSTIRDRHFDPTLGGVDWDAVRLELRPRLAAAGSREEVTAILGDMVSRLGQSHFQIIPKETLAALGRAVEEGAAGGETGIDARVVGGEALVTSVLEGSPAATAGVQPGWEIAAIDGETLDTPLATVAAEFQGRSWRDAYLSAVVKGRLTGVVGENLRVKFEDGASGARELTLRLVEPRGQRYSFGFVKGVPVWIEVRALAGGIGYIAFSSFLAPLHLMPVFNDAMESFQEAPGVILDLRGNEGGIGAMVMGMAGWFTGEKDLALGTMRLRDSELRFVVFPRPEPYAGPVAVLVDELSCSGAEVLADGLRSLGRARLFGRRTAGMVLASQFEELPNGDGFQFVFADYVSASGKHLEDAGVEPDVEVVPRREALLAGRDATLEAALTWITQLNHEEGAASGDPLAAGRTR